MRMRGKRIGAFSSPTPHGFLSFLKMAAGKENLTPVLRPRKIQTQELKKTDKDEQNEQFGDIENLSAEEILKRIKGCYGEETV